MAKWVVPSAPPILIHLTGGPHILESIVAERKLRAVTPLGAVHRHDQLGRSQSAVSLSEIDLTDLDRLASRHGGFGLAFQRRWVQERGGAPVWYLPRGSVVQQKLYERVRQLAFRRDPDLEHFLWEFTPFIDYPKDRELGGGPYDWRWEREWRVVGDLGFQHDDVVVLFAPEAQHRAVQEVWRRIASAAPVPPLVDVAWGVEAQIETMRSTRAPTGSPGLGKNAGSIAGRDRSWLAPPSEPPNDPAFDDGAESESVPSDPDADWLEEEANPDLKVMRELETDQEFDLAALVWFEAVLDSTDDGVSADAEETLDLSDDDLGLVEMSDEWDNWLDASRDDGTEP